MIFIGFSKAKGFKPFSWLIRAWQGGTKYSHVMMRYHDKETNLTMVFEASHGTVHLIEYEAWREKNTIVDGKLMPLDNWNMSMFKRKAYKLLQRPYSIGNIIGLAVRKITGLTVFDDGKRAFICSELAITLFPELKHGDKNDDFYEPVDLHKAIFGVK